MEIPLDKKVEKRTHMHPFFLTCLKIFFLSGTTRSERQERWEGQKRFFSLMLTFLSDMIFVQNITQPDFQAKIFTPHKCVTCDIFLAN